MNEESLNELREKRLQLIDKCDELTYQYNVANNKLAKVKKQNIKIIILTFILLGILGVVLFFLTIIFGVKNEDSTNLLLTLFGGSLFIIILSMFLLKPLLNLRTRQYIKIIKNSSSNLQTTNIMISVTMGKLEQASREYLANKYNISLPQLEYDLNSIPRYNLKNSWYIDKEHLDVIENALSKKYKQVKNAEAKDDLQVENLKLKNESIAIDNKQKKFWTCEYCGNVNLGQETSCIKCGASRKI